MILLIDVRTAEEYAERHAEGALHLPLDDLLSGEMGVLSGVEKNTPLRLYCRSGNRSERAQQILEVYGFSDVINLGGLEDAEKEALS